jgi:hypothetical protein
VPRRQFSNSVVVRSHTRAAQVPSRLRVLVVSLKQQGEIEHRVGAHNRMRLSERHCRDISLLPMHFCAAASCACEQ